MSRIRVSVAGATGYSGGELTALLARHPRVDLASMHSGAGRAAGAGASGGAVPFSGLHPSLAGKSGPDAEPFSVERLVAADPDVVFLATPNETSAEAVPGLLSAGIAVIDLSGAFRLREPEDYPRWYGFRHPAPELLAEAVYGLTEWATEIGGARLVANPGCYPTSVLLALKPILPLLSPGEPVVADSASGVSGAGRKAGEAFSFAEVSGNFRAYGVGSHRHEPEIRAGLGLAPDTPFVFVAHLLPAVRGILSTIHVGFAGPRGAEEVSSAYREAYARCPFVEVLPAGQLPDLRSVAGTPRAVIGFTLLDGGRRAVVVSVLDNLLKGAASQAVQNFNAVFGLNETLGLEPAAGEP